MPLHSGSNYLTITQVLTHLHPAIRRVPDHLLHCTARIRFAGLHHIGGAVPIEGIARQHLYGRDQLRLYIHRHGPFVPGTAAPRALATMALLGIVHGGNALLGGAFADALAPLGRLHILPQ